ncbi:transposase [Burkholderia sp. Ac-20344]|nr:transposase [Burkholderia sp. Ac-20344]
MIRTLSSDEVWTRIESVLSSKKGDPRRTATDNHRFVEAGLCTGRTGCPWCELSKEFGRWHMVYMRFSRWFRKGACERLAHAVSDETEINVCCSTRPSCVRTSFGWRSKKRPASSRSDAPNRVEDVCARNRTKGGACRYPHLGCSG